MAAIYWIAKIYKYYLIGWVLASWIPGLNSSDLYGILGLPLYPVLAPFSFLHLGPVGFEAIIPLILLGMLERWAGRNAGLLTEDGQQTQPVQQSSLDKGNFNPMDAADGSYPGNNTGI